MSTTNVFDICIVGHGISGAFAALKIAHSHKKPKTLIIEAGAAPSKRKLQMSGFLGLFTASDGKLYLNDLESVSALTSKAKTKKAFEWFKAQTKSTINLSVIKDSGPSISTTKRIKKAGFQIKLNNYIQLFPQEIHQLSRLISGQTTEVDNITNLFDTEVLKIDKERNHFVIYTDNDEVFKAKKVLINVGRSGWRWAHELFKSLDIVDKNNVAEIGVRVETTSSIMSGFNGSNCSIVKDGLSVGPLSHKGTVIPEDHYEFVCSSFRGNESRWETDKVSFNLFSKRTYEGSGVEQANRLNQLAFILTNERVAKERLSTLLAKKSKLSILPEYDWLVGSIREVSAIIPELATKGYAHFPSLQPMTSQIKLKPNLESEDIGGLFLSGESMGVHGILAAIVSGIQCAESMLK